MKKKVCTFYFNIYNFSVKNINTGLTHFSLRIQIFLIFISIPLVSTNS